jgi:anthranilate phosphoribosyltransferase
LGANRDLSVEEASWALSQMMTGAATDDEMSQFMLGLREKGETVTEVTSMVETMLGRCVRVDVAGAAVDIVGTGGDRANTVNVSTMAALVAAGAGIQVIKHGNRAVSSKSGAADLLEALGVDIEIDPDRIPDLVEEVGIGFCFAPRCHPAMAHAGRVRRQLGVSTVFNLLGPLANPARPKSQVIGVAEESRARLVAEVSQARGVKALVVHSQNGLDELTSTAPIKIWDVTAEMQEVLLDPKDLGFGRTAVSDLVGVGPTENAQVAKRLLAGEAGDGLQAARDAVLLSAAAGLVAHDAAVGVTRPKSLLERMSDALGRARNSLDSGAAKAVLEDWVAHGQKGSKGDKVALAS